MNTRKLAIQAISYLESLNKPLPDESETAWYKQNERNYKALLKLNNANMGKTMDELKALASAPLADRYAKEAIERMFKIDAEISKTYKREDEIEKTPSLWHGFFSGYEVTPKAVCKRQLEALERKREKLNKQHAELAKSITAEQAQKFSYPLECLDGIELCAS
ncbi:MULTISPECIES: hypothetical protein [Pseudoalteromonas]|uniref:hypothetical protein n=1 Tax=Pseudoalteromonas TaxID=53246 RepID=UPI001583F9AA|nr:MULTISPECIES: hypothetical protein [Pseudoalteromonas]MDI4652558.1 hypothetical protein [Pseudoalteromonas shioyasakiensis]NUJ38734.1 hypothetical protein [Pseudoalteromonas sp. 0303]